METRRFAEVSVLHIEPETYAQLLSLAENQPGRSGVDYDAGNPWHNLIVEPHTYGCWVHTGTVEDGLANDLPTSLNAVLRKAFESDAAWVLFDRDVTPLLDLPVFDHPDGPKRPGRADGTPGRPKRVVFSYPVPVCVVVEDDLVADVVVIDETEVTGCTLIEGDPADLAAAVAAATDGQGWPGWRFGW